MQWNITQPWKEWNNAIYNNMGGPRDYEVSEVSQRKTNTVWHYLHVKFFLKNGINELIYKTELGSQM